MRQRLDRTALVEVRRGGEIESIHRVIVVICDVQGKVVKKSGEVNFSTFLRSAAKPLQLLPLAESGLVERFRFSRKELAVMAASHSGEDIHVEAVKSILEKIGLGPEALQCGVHYPLDKEAARRLMEAGQEPSVWHNNCSGKHAGMLALAVGRGHPTSGYYRLEHPVQQAILENMARLMDMGPSDIVTAIDGCGVPTFKVPLWRMAMAYARLVDPHGLPSSTQEACRRVTEAMRSHPEMVGGTKGRLDTDLMRLKRNLVAKGGAEGYFAIGITSDDGHGLGIAIKAEDGSSRGGEPMTLEVLRQLGFLNEEELEALKSYHCPPVVNHRGEIVGEVRPCLRLKDG